MSNAENITSLSFRPLGYLDGKYYHYSFLLQKVIALSPVEHRKENLFNLAPLSYWVKEYGEKKGSWEIAVDSLIQTCAAEGLFSPLNIIGRGIWIIEGQGVTHYGDKVLIGGKKYSPKEIPREIAGKKVFEVQESLQLGEADKSADFTQIESILSELHFQTPHAALLISGWLVCAMAAGALHWRPHGWITGRSGSGKSAVIQVLNTILRNCAEFYVGESSEAGIRQDLKNDCRAIIFDEAEPKNHAAIQKITNVLNLLRQASSDETGKIAKGTVSGKGMSYKIRSCGFMGSCNAQLTEEPDKNRFMVLEMGSPMPKEEFDIWEFRMENTFTKGFQAALHNRISENIVTLAANAKIFASVLAERFKNNRAGDQYGTLMAGAYLLTNIGKATREIAADWMSDIKFSIESETSSDRSDESDLWNYILERMIVFKKEQSNNFGTKSIITLEKPLAELIDVAFGNQFPTDYASGDAQKILSYKGIKCVIEEAQQFVAVSTNHSAIADLISRSRFAGLEWSPILRRIDGNIASKKPYRIGISGNLSKVTLIPWKNSNVTRLQKVTQKVTEYDSELFEEIA